MIRNFIDSSARYYDFVLEDFQQLSPSTYLAYCKSGNKYFIKRTNLYQEEKYLFLYNQGLDNILFPIRNKENRFVTRKKNDCFYIANFINDFYMLDEVRLVSINQELQKLHFQTYFKRQLSPSRCRHKLDELFAYLEYKFYVLELFVRSVEARPFDEYSIVILKNYRYILEAKKHIGRFHQKLLYAFREHKSVNYSFIHNNPKLEHLLIYGGKQLLTSIENSKVGICSLDMAKLYIENAHLNVDLRSLIIPYFKKYEDEFYYEYFCFLVLLYYIKSITIIDKDYISAQSFIYISKAIKKFIDNFIENEA